MLRFLFFLFSIISAVSHAQVIDDFNDSDFTSNPAWGGDAAEFIVNTSKQLQLNNTVADTSYLSTANNLTSLDNVEWNFFIKLSFAPSGNNYAKFYLTSDQANLKGSLNGYYLRFGEGGSTDAVELFRQTGTASTSVARGTSGSIAASFVIRVKVTRDNSANWKVYVDYTGGTNYVLEASGTDNTYFTSSFLGAATVYTVSNSKSFYFDDIYNGPIILDLNPPVISFVNVISSTKLDVYFNEIVEQTSAEALTNYSVNNGIGNPTTTIRDASNFTLVHLTFSSSFSNGSTNTITVSNVTDLAGNKMITSNTDFTYYDIFPAAPNDIVINEILFDPKTGGVDFVEIYNRSNKAIDLKNLVIGEQDTITNLLVDTKDISANTYLLLSGKYLVLTSDISKVKSQYVIKDENAFLALSTLPSMNVSGDVVVIADKNNIIIDKVIYTEDMHFPLLGETKGVSLERVNFNRPSDDKTNWHSAAEDAGFATPGYINSQYSGTRNDDGEVTIEPEIFSPDNDGEKDVVGINYKFEEPGMTANVTIYDSKGRLIRNLVRNELLGTSGAFSWDGVDDERQKARIGIYIIYFEAFSTSGKVKKIKKTCVLAGRFN